MKVYKQVAHQVNEYQNKNMQIEIQYSTCANEETVIYSALILGYTEE